MSHSGKTLSSMSRRVADVRFRNKSSLFGGSDTGRRANVWKKILDDVCDQCSLHGLNHIVGKDRSTGEKAFWSVTVICAVLFATYAIVESWKSYNKSAIDTVVETTFFSYADIAFPMVVVCDSSRVDWQRVTKLTARDVPDIDPGLLPVVRKLLKTFSVLSYGEFEEFDELKNVTELSELAQLNLTELLVKVMRPCDEVFPHGGCWWNFKQVNCCDIFELQRTEFGLCHSFNSDFSEYSRARLGADSGLIGSFWRTESGVMRPRRTGDNGQWSGVRMYVTTMDPKQVAPGVDAKQSTRIMIGEPRGHPLGSDMVVTGGSIGIIHVWGDRIYNTNRTRSLKPKERRCIFADESSTGMGTKYYLRRNCKTACYMNHMVHHCGCYLEFMFGLMHQNDSLRPCNVEDLSCLSEKNSFFKSHIPSEHNVFMTNDIPGLKCDCMPDCVHQMYISELTIAEPSISTVLIPKPKTDPRDVVDFCSDDDEICMKVMDDFEKNHDLTDNITGFIEVAPQIFVLDNPAGPSNQNVVDFCSDDKICMEAMDDFEKAQDLSDSTTVSFGGCAGLFLGGSLLSFIELIYFLTWKAYHHWRQTPSTTVVMSKSKKKRKHRRRINMDTWTIDDDNRANNSGQTDRFTCHV